MIIPKSISERYLEIETRLAQLEEEGGAAENEATALYLEKVELDELIQDPPLFHAGMLADQKCVYCGTLHKLGECSYLEAEARR